MLDEPFHSVDSLGKRSLFDALKKLKDEYHSTILLISHDFKEVSDFADEIIILRDEKIYSSKTPIDLALTADDYEKLIIND